MNMLSPLAENRLLQVHWTEQFIKESQIAIEHETMEETARIVLFYAGLAGINVELEQKGNPSLTATVEQAHWLATEQDVVAKALETVPDTYHGLLQMCLVISTLTVNLELQDNELRALRAKASSFIDYVGGRAQSLEQWFH
ncbi:hypothetical protein [Paenibacillus sp. RC67]|uniref:hypothetical protein n=1 Tax=Paenibacillus sp. RC67 TaxID=3039392 RepID=UPI0024AD1866|nr:hypothetical protein [Paenibacillus sp. RC67]